MIYFPSKHSLFDGVRFSTDPVGRFDQDVIQEFPGDTPLRVTSTSAHGYRTRVDASMFLLENHPQPFAMSNSIEVKSRKNPNPRRFVGAYDTVSEYLTVPTKRLFGRASIPDEWSDEKKAHYLAHAQDPRYASLAGTNG